MKWFGFGFNAFGQIRHIANREGHSSDDVKLILPQNIHNIHQVHEPKDSSCEQISCVDSCHIRASWSRRAYLHFKRGNRCVCLSGFGAGRPVEDDCCGNLMQESVGCRDALITERYLTLSFSDRIECWNLEQDDKTPVWSMDIKTPSDKSESLGLPLVPGGYIALKPPFYRPLSPQLKATSLALGAEHAILLTATGSVYSWGNGSHGQLGHEVLNSEDSPRAMEALLGVPMSCVATGSWHSACISTGGDLYVWGWNESGQLGLPSRALRKAKQRSQQQTGTKRTSEDSQEGENHEEVFISIQAFPALMDITPLCEVTKVSCGSRHTAAVTSTGSLYTWGWGEYGQLGHETVTCSDEPQCVEFFENNGLNVVDVVCGAWNTFAAAIEKEVTLS